MNGARGLARASRVRACAVIDERQTGAVGRFRTDRRDWKRQFPSASNGALFLLVSAARETAASAEGAIDDFSIDLLADGGPHDRHGLR
jgi:hypothetical protein